MSLSPRADARTRQATVGRVDTRGPLEGILVLIVGTQSGQTLGRGGGGVGGAGTKAMWVVPALPGRRETLPA